jgi:hypothetical protein
VWRGVAAGWLLDLLFVFLLVACGLVEKLGSDREERVSRRRQVGRQGAIR